MAVRPGVLRRLLPGKAVAAKARTVSAAAPRSHWLSTDADEYFRRVYTRGGLQSGQALAVCSAIAGEGRTTVALGLAATLARDFPDWRIALVETDPHHPTLAADFGLAQSPGLTEVVQDGYPVATACRSTRLENLRLVPVGGPAGNPSALLRSSQLAAALAELRREHDLLILDLPALLADSAVLPLAGQTDGVLFVVRAGQTPRSLVERALADLAVDQLRGVVLNGTASAVPDWLRRLAGLEHE